MTSENVLDNLGFEYSEKEYKGQIIGNKNSLVLFIDLNTKYFQLMYSYGIFCNTVLIFPTFFDELEEIERAVSKCIAYQQPNFSDYNYLKPKSYVKNCFGFMKPELNKFD